MTLSDMASLATVVSALFAAIAAGIALWTIHVTKRMSIEARANDLVKTSIELAIKNPKLSTEPKNREEQLYEWYCQYILMMGDEVLKAHPGDQHWRRYVRDQLRYIKDGITNWHKPDFQFFGDDLKGLVTEVTEDKKS
jgi:hypothetical protein